ncbi:MAG: response regulator [Chitinispirillales bacterium]|jgi:PAS domain S-box-containing protein|nr:response regulator [Chitinispirillales bacterium]
MDYYTLIFVFIALILCVISFYTVIRLLKGRKFVVSKKTLENLLNGLDICLFVNESHSCRLLFVNEKLKKIFNIKGEVAGKHSYDVLGHCYESKAGFCPKERLIRDSEKVIVSELKHKANGKHYRLFAMLIDWIGIKDAQLVYLLDITETVKVEKQLRLMKSFINSSRRTTMACVRNDGKFSFFNPYSSELSGYSQQEMEESGISVLFDKKSQKVLKEEILPLIAENGEHRFEMPLVNKNGKTHQMDYLGFQVESDLREEFGFVGHDITGMRELEDELLKAKKCAEHANSAKIEFLMAMSHEIRTPMNAIIGMTKIALNADDPKKKEECLKKIEKSSWYLLNVINEILDISKIEANRTELVPKVFDFESTVKNIFDMLDIHSKGKRHKFIVNIGDVPASLIGDDVRLSQIIVNLLSNAVKFTPENGTVTFEIKNLGEDDESCELQVEVKDSGIGISAQQQERIFDSYEHSNSSVERKFGSAGLGLAISKKIVELMGGRLWVESELGKGAKFLFTVKLQKDKSGNKRLKIDSAEDDCFQKTGKLEIRPAANNVNKEQIIKIPEAFMPEAAPFKLEALKPVAEISIPGDRKVVLLAEDVDVNRELITMFFKGSGIIFDFAENGREAVALFSRDPDRYCLILMDVQMPVMDGYEATRKIRALEPDWSKQIPIIAMTANVFKEEIDLCFEVGMDDHVGKPVDMDLLREKIISFLMPSVEE